MAQLSEILASVLRDVALARAESDKMSARLAQEYSKDEMLKHFPVPRVDIDQMTIQLRAAFSQRDKSGMQVIIDASSLKELGEAVSVITLTTGVKNYELVQRSDGSKSPPVLIESR